MGTAEATRGQPVMSVRGLTVEIEVPAGVLHAVTDVGFDVHRGETLSIVGESGCGKSITALALMNLLPRRARLKAETLRLEGDDLLAFNGKQFAAIRGNRMGMIFQDPMTSLNPVYKIGDQMEEIYLQHGKGNRREARARAEYLLAKVGITGIKNRLGQYPHQLSGGLRQRVMIAMTLMCDPALVIADEPTTALDVTIQAQILHLLNDLKREFHMALILITHDLGVVARTADRVAVMYAGRMVETGSARKIFAEPSHPYTQGLLRCIPVPGAVRDGARLGSIPGLVPAMVGDFDGCMFRNRCNFASESCAAGLPPEHSLGVGHSYSCVLTPERCAENYRTAIAGEAAQ